ncbi:hypothetical protein FSZ31_01095 [Sphingorhabdus soli]|uniref:DUF5681 domain-containing protein n=1 Tax=Flavisphingopyxis soli TaxID=2601267 RepID=A0A5C6UMQ2_9SPHN|nr:DUF5681 domain-containing protein [Sphingorhabdus soli]TXC73386.1 hypothetical protein FSZ31_01095 [Sphingorhabdus soli]
MADSPDDEVGYGRPPKHTRWQKGQSGNPRGRPKSSRGLKADLHAELISRMEIQMNGKRISGTKQQLMLKTLTARAASGDVRAIKALIDLVMQVFGPEDRGAEAKRLSTQDQQILDQLLGRGALTASNAVPAIETDTPTSAKQEKDDE